MLNNYLFRIVTENLLDEIWSQQDDTICHFANNHLLQEYFVDHICSKNGPVNYSARFCDLKLCDYIQEMLKK